MPCRQPSLYEQIEEFFARSDIEFIDCPILTRPMLKIACENRQKTRGHWVVGGAEETGVISDYFRCCEGCKHFYPDERKNGKMTKHKKLAKYGIGCNEEDRMKRREEIKAKRDKEPRSPQLIGTPRV